MMRVSADVVVTASYDYTAKVWAGLHCNCLHTLLHPEGEITCVGIGCRFVCVCVCMRLQVYYVRMIEIRMRLHFMVA